jgi:hypothetical protein
MDRELVMRITQRQLKRIIREVIEGPDGVWYDDYGNPLQPDQLEDEGLTGDDALIDALIFGWEQSTGEAPDLSSPQEKGDAALAWVSANEPDIARQINALSTHNLKALFDTAFDEDTDHGHRTSAMDWNR